MRNQQAEKERTPEGGISEAQKVEAGSMLLRREVTITSPQEHVKCPLVVRVTPRGRFVSMGRAIA